MDKLVEKVWDKHSYILWRKGNGLIPYVEVLGKNHFEGAITDYNSQRKCENCKKCETNIFTYPLQSTLMKSYLCDGVELIPRSIADKNFSPFCFTNLFEMKEK